MATDLQHQERSLRLVIVSPHADDGVLSVGAAMAAWARSGYRVELLTVLGCDPESQAPAGGWDHRAGFVTEGDAARGRRDEDRHASEILGVSPTWLPFGSLDYERHGDDDEVWDAMVSVRDADFVLVPGSPLTHPDHAWLFALVAERMPMERLGLYAEQPYTQRDGGAPFSPVDAEPRDRLAKWRAIRSYRSQLRLLGMAGVVAPARLALVVERVKWPDGRGPVSPGSSLRSQ
jgi:LmbE family N-acetylglucosaminyl deacetylase